MSNNFFLNGWALVFGLFLAGCGGCNTATQNGKETTMGASEGMWSPVEPRPKVIEEWRRLMPSMGPDGDHTNAGRVRAGLRVPSTLTPARSFLARRFEPPQEIVASFSGNEIAVDGLLFKVDDPTARVWGYGGSAVFFPDGFTSDGRDQSVIPWHPSIRLELPRFEAGNGTILAFARSPAMLAVVLRGDPVPPAPHDPPERALVGFLGAGVRTLRANGEYRTVGGYMIEGASGGGAIGYDARIAFFTDAGRFMILSYNTAEAGRLEVDVTLPVRPKNLSITSAGYALLSGGSGAGNYLQVLDEKGEIKWATAVGFNAEQPAIDGGNGRLYLVGNGFAAFENGKPLWSSSSSERVSAMAFSDGALAMTVGTELRIVDRQGQLRAKLSAPEGEVLGRPAVAPDGAIWVASRTTLYVAR